MAVDLILTGATICPIAGAPVRNGAVAIRGDRIHTVGAAAEIAALAGPSTRIIHFPPDHTIIPAFNDSHQHLLSFVRARSRVSLWQTASIAAVLDAIRRVAEQRPAGSWIVAVGHDQGRLAEKRHPTLAELDAAVPGHPLLIIRACSHIALANSLALERAGITAATPDPPGGRVERDSDGYPTGILLEAAMSLASSAVEAPAIDWEAGLREAAREYHRRGIVAIGEAALGHVAGMQDLELMNRLVRGGELGLRMYVMAYGPVREQLLQAAEVRRAEQKGRPGEWENGRRGEPKAEHPEYTDDPWLRFGCIKYFADGTLGGGTAWLSEDYGDEPGNRGWPLLSAEELDQQTLRAHRAGFQVAIHAIGDAAVAMALNSYERALAAQPRANHRHRVEHVEVIHPGMTERFARLEVVAAIQSCFTYWEEGDVTRLGPGLAPWGHAWGSLQRAGVVLANGSDNPVLPDFAPLQGIAAAVTRRTHHGLELAPQQAISVAEALRSYTWGGAYASFSDHEQGALAPGMLADIAVIAGDLATPDPAAIAEMQVVMTIAGGRVVAE